MQRPAPIPSTPAGSKRRATQVIDSLALGEHVKRERGVADAVRAGLPMRGDAATLEALSRGEGVGFGKHAGWVNSVGEKLVAGGIKKFREENPEGMKALAREAGGAAAEQAAAHFENAAKRVIENNAVVKRYDDAVGMLRRGGKVTAGLGAAGLGLYGINRGLHHYEELKKRKQEQQRLDQQQKLLEAFERHGRRGADAPRHRPRLQSTELPGAPVRNTIQPKFSSNTDIGTMS